MRAFVCPECGDGFEARGFCPQHGTELADATDDPLLGEKIEPYRVARLLGVGGMGRVYLGVHPAIGSRVAIKVLSRDRIEDHGLVQRFFDEARAVNVIRHENIVNILDLARLSDGRPYITMEYLDGAPLSAVIQRRGPLPLGGFARAVGEVLDALQAAHDKGIIHRDLKPDNIFVSPSGRAKVLDFGIAKLIPELGGRSDPTRTGSLLGTPHYMSPEQTLARKVDSRADLYSCGVILFEGATGTRPFAADSLFDLMRKHLEQPPPAPRSLRPDIPPPLEALILRAMQKDPAARFATAREMGAALVEATRSLPEHAWTPIAPTEGSTPAAIPSPPPAVTPRGATQPKRSPSEAFAATMASPHLDTRKEDKRRPAWILPVALALVAAALAAGVVYLAMRGGAADTGLAPIAGAGPPDAAPAGAPADAGAVAIVAPADAAPASGAAVARHRRPPTKSSPDAGVTRIVTRPTIDAGVRKGAFDPAKFDPSRYAKKALRRARNHWEDAVFVRLDVDGVFPDGHADFTLDDGFSALYRFISPSRAKGDPDTPIGVAKKTTCVYYVNVDKSGVNAYELKGWSCDDYIPIARPKCSMKQVWKRAIEDGAPGSNAVAGIGYWASKSSKARWSFSVKDHYSSWIDDDCK